MLYDNRRLEVKGQNHHDNATSRGCLSANRGEPFLKKKTNEKDEPKTGGSGAKNSLILSLGCLTWI